MKSNPDACWEYPGARDKKGYGSVSRNIHGEGLAHRASWRILKGDIPEGLLVCHRCNNPPCVNPDHLYIADNAQNIKDAWRDGLGRNQNTQKSKCPRCGSEYSLRAGYNWRRCIPCKLASDRRTKPIRRIKRIFSELAARGKDTL